MDMSSEFNIVQHGHSLKQFNILEGTGYTESCYLVWGQMRDVLVLEQ